jgi:hypothetical protein
MFSYSHFVLSNSVKPSKFPSIKCDLKTKFYVHGENRFSSYAKRMTRGPYKLNVSKYSAKCRLKMHMFSKCKYKFVFVGTKNKEKNKHFAINSEFNLDLGLV